MKGWKRTLKNKVDKTIYSIEGLEQSQGNLHEVGQEDKMENRRGKKSVQKYCSKIFNI